MTSHPHYEVMGMLVRFFMERWPSAKSVTLVTWDDQVWATAEDPKREGGGHYLLVLNKTDYINKDILHECLLRPLLGHL